MIGINKNYIVHLLCSEPSGYTLYLRRKLPVNILIFVILLFGIVACEKKPEKIEYITLLEGVKRFQIEKIEVFAERKFFPKLWQELNNYGIIYAISSIKNNIILFKTIGKGSGKNFTVIEYQNINDQLLLLRETQYYGTFVDDTTFDKAGHKLNIAVTGDKREKILIDTSYHYEANEKGEFQVKYERSFDANKRHITGDETYELYKYENNKPVEMMKENEDVSSLSEERKQEIKTAMQIFEAYDDYENARIIYDKESNKTKLKYPKEQLEVEKQLNIEIDYNIPYYGL